MMDDHEAKAAREVRLDAVGKCWSIITTSLHDDLFLKLVHVEQGHIATLMAEIRAALLVNIAEDVQPLRLELYAASMAKDCNNDLQSFIAYIIQRKDKLLFLKVAVPDEELSLIFLKGLPSVFQPYKCISQSQATNRGPSQKWWRLLANSVLHLWFLLSWLN